MLFSGSYRTVMLKYIYVPDMKFANSCKMGHGTLQTVLEVKALVMDSPMPHSFVHQIVCNVVDKSKRLIKAERV